MSLAETAIVAACGVDILAAGYVLRHLQGQSQPGVIGSFISQKRRPEEPAQAVAASQPEVSSAWLQPPAPAVTGAVWHDSLDQPAPVPAPPAPAAAAPSPEPEPEPVLIPYLQAEPGPGPEPEPDPQAAGDDAATTVPDPPGSDRELHGMTASDQAVGDHTSVADDGTHIISHIEDDVATVVHDIAGVSDTEAETQVPAHPDPVVAMLVHDVSGMKALLERLIQLAEEKTAPAWAQPAAPPNAWTQASPR